MKYNTVPTQYEFIFKVLWGTTDLNEDGNLIVQGIDPLTSIECWIDQNIPFVTCLNINQYFDIILGYRFYHGVAHMYRLQLISSRKL